MFYNHCFKNKHDTQAIYKYVCSTDTRSYDIVKKEIIASLFIDTYRYKFKKNEKEYLGSNLEFLRKIILIGSILEIAIK